MFTRGESCPGLPQLFRRRVKISAVGGRDAAGGGYTYPELQLAMVIRRRREVAGRRPPPPEAGVTEFRGDPESDPDSIQCRFGTHRPRAHRYSLLERSYHWSTQWYLVYSNHRICI